MKNWKPKFKTNIIEWLLEKDNPSVRYFTLTKFLGKNETEPEVEATRQEIMTTGIVPKILAKQNRDGYWGKAEDFYERSKYKGTVWNLIILAQLGADGSDDRIKKTCEFILKNSQDKQSGGFAYEGSSRGGGYHSKVIPCLTGNILWSLIRLGYREDSRVQQGINWITTYQRFDDRIKEPAKGWPYDKYKNCWGKHTCYMGIIKTLKTLAEIPENKRTKVVKSTIKNAVEFILKHQIYKRSHNLSRIIKPKWLKFSFPLMYDTDVLEILDILTKLGYKDNRIQDAINLVISKQDKQGKWNLETTFNGRFLVNIEQQDKPSKWVTLKAIKVLKRYFE